MKMILAAILAFAPALAQAAPTLESIEMNRKACQDKAESQVEMSDCEAKTTIVAEKLLTSAYKQKISDSGSAKVKAALVKAQRAWITFRDADCVDYVGSSFEGGNGAGLAIETCLNDRRLTRIQQLQSF